MGETFKFECRYQLRSPLFLILSAVFFLFAFALIGSESVSLGGVSDSLHLNAAWTIVYTQFFFSIIGMLAAISIVSQAITRDYELHTAEMLFATGVSERGFLLGRFFAGCVFGILVGVAALLGTLAGSLMPWLDAERVGPFAIEPFVYGLFVVTAPNLFFSSALFFSVAALTRSMLAAFCAAVGFIVLYAVVSAMADPEQVAVFALLDPFGGTAFGEVSRYWTVYERNYNLVPLEGNLLFNRLLWLSVGIVALAVTAWRYHFTLNASPFQGLRRRLRKPSKETAPAREPVQAQKRFGAASILRQTLSQIRVDLAGVYKSVPFYAILGFATLNVWGGFEGSASTFGTPLLPVTGALVRVISGSYLFFLLMIIIYYAGEIVHRERQTGVAEVLDAMPFPNGVMIASKILALWFIVTALLAFGMFAGMLRQWVAGYDNFEVGLYLFSIFFMEGSFFYLLCVLAVFIQVLCANKWLGMVVMISVFIGFQVLPSLGFEHALYNFGPSFQTPHSDMNGYGHYLAPQVALTVYWSLFCVLAAVAAHLFYPRGQLEGFGQRMRLGRARVGGVVTGVSAAALILFCGVGGWLYYNMNLINEYRVSDDVEAQQAAYEHRYKALELQATPEALAVDSEVDLYPQERRLESRGRIVLANLTDAPMDDVLIGTHAMVRVNALQLQAATRFEHDAELGVHRFRFEPALQPGDEAVLTFDLTWDHNGIANTNQSALFGNAFDRVVENGTFVNNTEIMPTVGYNSGLELTDPNKRREQELPPIVRLPKMGDTEWLDHSQFGVSRRTAFRTVFSTSADQIAVAPGYLVGDVVENGGRRTYTYAMDEPIWPFFSFSSARYEVAEDRWNDVAIEVYHDPKHPYNIEPMIRGTKKSLDYFSTEFSPYQYRQFRILEFPRYARFAQSFPNTIPFSEAIGFVADLTDEHAIDLVFYVTAHEMAHQWWGHQVAGAYMQGMTVIVETLAQYSALMVMEREYGPDKMRRFLRYELDRYLGARGGELIAELPLQLTENQPYIHYSKGSLVMYALKDAIGEARVNQALRNFLAEYSYGTGPFPTAVDLVRHFRALAEPEHQELITDLFEKITLYDLSVTDAELREVDDGWEVRFTANAEKFYADGKGEETAAPLSAWIDIAVFPEAPDDLEDYQLPAPLVFERRLIESDTAEFVLVVPSKPARVGIDPYNKLIDRNPEDNLKVL